MFVFYYAVLSEVSPPDGAVALRGGGDHGRETPTSTTLHSWKYTMPAFLVPFAFMIAPAGVGLLLMRGSALGIAHVATFTAALGIAALACGVQGWMFTPHDWPSGSLVAAGLLLLVYPRPGPIRRRGARSRRLVRTAAAPQGHGARLTLPSPPA